MEDLPDSFDAPIIQRIGGDEISFPILDIDELMAAGRAAQSRAMAAALAKLSIAASNDERENVRRYYQDREATVDDLTASCWTLTGSIDYLVRSLIKGSKPAADAKSIVHRLGREKGWRAVAFLAKDVCGLFERKPTEKTPPNGGAAAGQPAAGTGDATESSSNDSADAAPAA